MFNFVAFNNDMTPKSQNKVNPQMITIARESRGILQMELAEKTAISKSSLNRMELGTQEIGNEIAV
ncbi:MAG: helix-turn-helix domain-containing protein, partial [Cytophagaceae bacterium]